MDTRNRRMKNTEECKNNKIPFATPPSRPRPEAAATPDSKKPSKRTFNKKPFEPLCCNPFAFTFEKAIVFSLLAVTYVFYCIETGTGFFNETVSKNKRNYVPNSNETVVFSNFVRHCSVNKKLCLESEEIDLVNKTDEGVLVSRINLTVTGTGMALDRRRNVTQTFQLDAKTIKLLSKFHSNFLFLHMSSTRMLSRLTSSEDVKKENGVWSWRGLLQLTRTKGYPYFPLCEEPVLEALQNMSFLSLKVYAFEVKNGSEGKSLQRVWKQALVRNMSLEEESVGEIHTRMIERKGVVFNLSNVPGNVGVNKVHSFFHWVQNPTSGSGKLLVPEAGNGTGLWKSVFAPIWPSVDTTHPCRFTLQRVGWEDWKAWVPEDVRKKSSPKNVVISMLICV